MTGDSYEDLIGKIDAESAARRPGTSTTIQSEDAVRRNLVTRAHEAVMKFVEPELKRAGIALIESGRTCYIRVPSLNRALEASQFSSRLELEQGSGVSVLDFMFLPSKAEELSVTIAIHDESGSDQETALPPLVVAAMDASEVKARVMQFLVASSKV